MPACAMAKNGSDSMPSWRPLRCPPLDRQPAQRAGLWRRQYGPSHGTGLADALIAASVAAAGATLVTLNRRHFPMLADVLVPYAKG